MTDMWSAEYRAKKGDVELFMFRKRVGEPKAGEDPLPVLFLVHGSSFSGPSCFDLDVPGKPGYSLMEHFARLGFDVWTLDHEGYGRSSRTTGNSDIASGADDLRAGVEVVERETGLTGYAFYGASSGALRAALFAERHPEYVERLILDAFVWTGKDSPTLFKRAENLESFRASNSRPVDRAFFHSIFTRDRPGTSEDGVADALADVELQYGDTMPTGTYLDMCAHLPINDPHRIKCPVLIVRGEHDGIATEEDLFAFYRELPSRDKQFVIIPGQAHVSHLGINRDRFRHVVHRFLILPERVDG
jgi:pimeloyl-ACP methyl ester carboxylesterase